MTPAATHPQARHSTLPTTTPAQRCEHCGGPALAVADVSWEPCERTTPGQRQTCRDCLPAVIADAVDDTHVDGPITVEWFRPTPVKGVGRGVRATAA